MTDRKTPYLKLPLPHRDVSPEENVDRLQNALSDVDAYAARNDAAMAALDAELTCKVETLDAEMTCKVGVAQSTAQSAVADAAAARRTADEAKADAARAQATANGAATAAAAAQATANGAATTATAAQASANTAKAVTDTVSVSPGPGAIPRAGADGKLDAGWLPAVYALCEFYYFRHPTLKSGFQPAQGGVIANAATRYPAAWAYLQTAEGQLLCRTEAEWQAMTTATWATLADGTKVGWNGIGGASFYVQDLAAGTLRLPDLRGMYAEAAGFDALDVGGVHGDAIRGIAGTIPSVIDPGQWERSTGVFTSYRNGSAGFAGQQDHDIGINFIASRVVPTAAKNQPRAWGALACVYLGRPAS